MLPCSCYLRKESACRRCLKVCGWAAPWEEQFQLKWKELYMLGGGAQWELAPLTGLNKLADAGERHQKPTLRIPTWQYTVHCSMFDNPHQTYRSHPNNSGSFRSFSFYLGNSGNASSEILISTSNQIYLVFSLSLRTFPLSLFNHFFSFPQHWIMNLKSWITHVLKIALYNSNF